MGTENPTIKPIIKENPARESEVSNQIIPTQAKTLQVFDPEKDIQQGQKAAKALLKLVKLTKPLKLGGKDYLYFEHWITIARFYNATVGVEWTRKTETGWEAKAVVYQNGQMIGTAEAACNNDEANWKNKPDFQRKSMAQTRAASKALRQIFGYIPVLAGIEATPAEEMNNNHIEVLQASQTQEFGNTTMSNGQNVSKPISQKQALYIKSLRLQKGLEKISDEDLRKLNSEEASAEIKRLTELENIIEIDKPLDEAVGDYPQ
jgi:hypothetical protein